MTLPEHPFLNLLNSLDEQDIQPPAVAFNSPPPHLISDAIAHVTAQMAQVPKDAHGAVVAVATRGPDGMPSINAAVAIHGPMGVQVVTWIGKTWNGPIDYGIE